MAKQEMSGKALLDKLYSGLDTVPAVEHQMDARDFRRLTDDFLGKPTDATASGQYASKASAAADDDDDDDDVRPRSRTKFITTSLVALCLVAIGGVVAAGILREPDRSAALPLPRSAPIPYPAPLPPPEQVAVEVPAPEPVVLTNPFDKSEKFTFPPGTSKAEAREQMAALLLQRAADRGVQPRARKLAAEPRKPSTTAHGS